jgi:hypothetical protein
MTTPGHRPPRKLRNPTPVRTYRLLWYARWPYGSTSISCAQRPPDRALVQGVSCLGERGLATATRRLPANSEARPAAPRGSDLLGGPSQALAGLDPPTRYRQARDRDRLASAWLQVVLAQEVEKGTDRSTSHLPRAHRLHPTHLRRPSRVGRGQDRRGARRQVRDPAFGQHHSPLHGPASEHTAWGSDLAHLRPQPCQGGLDLRLPDSVHRPLRRRLHLRRHGDRLSADRPRQRHDQPDALVGEAADP